MVIQEANFDAIVGLTHNYAGMSPGNVASTSHAGQTSKPKAAALQGLAKMKAMADLGLLQGWLPPQSRPDLTYLRDVGGSGTTTQIIESASDHHLAQASSSSFMWAANAATVAPGEDTCDGRVHMVVANLQTMPHRRIEPPQTLRMLECVFPDASRFALDPPLSGEGFTDEGAANHTRLTDGRGGRGVHLFVYGDGSEATHRPSLFPARQTAEASRAVATLLDLPEDRVLLAQQDPEAIDAGVFHNDVIAVGNENVLLYHERAFLQEQQVIDDLQGRLGDALILIRVSQEAVSLEDAVRSYLFNSQLVSMPDGSMALISPTECEEIPSVHRVIRAIIDDRDNPIEHVHTFDLRESMRNGGGPACLRLRVGLNESEVAAVHQPCLYSDEGHAALVTWVNRWYPDELNPEDLRDPDLYRRSCDALDDLTTLLDLGDLYQFQR